MKSIIKRTLLSILICLIMVCVFALAGCNSNKNESLPVLTPQPEINDTGNLVEYTLSGAISSNMVVQQNKYIHVWGLSQNIGSYLYGEFMGEKRYAQVDENGEWEIIFSSHSYTSEPQTMDIYPTTGERIHLDDILIGDVWVVSGQSNAELQIDVTMEYNPEIKDEINENDNIRIYYQGLADVIANEESMKSPQKDVVNENYCWTKADYSNVMKFSAIGYYFAKEVSKHVNIPIGVVMMAAGGQSLKHFMPIDLSLSLGNENGANIYNSLIYPFARMEIKGMLFYQGENDNWNYEGYAENLAAFVERMRADYGYNFPFYNVQLSSHAGILESEWTGLGMLRCEQTEALSLISNSYLVASYDVGVMSSSEPDMAHPYNKKPVGDRLANIALTQEYNIKGYKMNYKACPVPESIKWGNGKATITFKYVGKGLKLEKGDDLSGFYLIDFDGQILKGVTAKISGDNKVIVDIPEKYEGKYKSIAYACKAITPIVKNNLYNSSDLPCVSFKFDKE